MSDEMNSAWRSIADEGADPVPVRVQENSAPVPDAAPSGTVSYVRVNPSMRGSMSLAAVSGILLVLLSGATFYLGTDFLRASITDSHQTINVSLSAQGVFVPPAIEANPGDTLIIQNDNENPQLLKSENASQQLFGQQVVLNGESYTYDIPLNAPAGTYTVTSEILPGQTLTITIVASQASSSSEQAVLSDASSSQNADAFMQDILIPSLNDLSSNAPSSVQSVPSTIASSSSSQAMQQPPVQQAQDQQFALPQQNLQVLGPLTKSIDTNPFTVGNQKRPLPGTSSSKSALHGGAPLITTHTPRSSTASGPGLWLLGLLGCLSAAFVAIRAKRVI